MSEDSCEIPTKKADLVSIIENLRNQKCQEINVGCHSRRDENFDSSKKKLHGNLQLSLDDDNANIMGESSTTETSEKYNAVISEDVYSVISMGDLKSEQNENNISEEQSSSEISESKNGKVEIKLMESEGNSEVSTINDKLNHVESARDKYGETTVSTEAIDISPQIQASLKSSRKRRMDRTIVANSTTNPDYAINNNNSINNNNNNNIKNERLSPGTPDTSSRSPSVTPSSASHPGTPPANEASVLPGGRNYSDFMRSLAAKYNNANPNDYFNAARNGFAPPLDPRFKPASFPVMPNISTPINNKENDLNNRKPEFPSILNPFVNSPLLPPLIDMSSTQTLLAMVRTAKEVELQGLLKNIKRPETSSPLDLSAAAPPQKKTKVKHPTSSSPSGGLILPNRAKSESPIFREDIKNWTVDDVCNFVSSIDICAEYAQNFRDQRIDGSGLPLLTEEHLTTTINMKLGPALKLKSMIAKRMGSCNICLHCTHCHKNSASPEPATTTGNSSDSGGTS